jgi:hypothetical protein
MMTEKLKYKYCVFNPEAQIDKWCQKQDITHQNRANSIHRRAGFFGRVAFVLPIPTIQATIRLLLDNKEEERPHHSSWFSFPS